MDTSLLCGDRTPLLRCRRLPPAGGGEKDTAEPSALLALLLLLAVVSDDGQEESPLPCRTRVGGRPRPGGGDTGDRARGWLLPAAAACWQLLGLPPSCSCAAVSMTRPAAASPPPSSCPSWGCTCWSK